MPLKIGAYHARVVEAQKGREWVAAALAQRGFSPVLEKARNAVSRQLKPLGLSLPAGLLGSTQAEVLVGEGQAILWRQTFGQLPRQRGQGAVGEIWAEERVPIVEVLLLTSGDLAALEKTIQEAVGGALVKHSWNESCTIERLRERLGELSPNGKKLVDPDARRAIRRLHDDELRARLAAIASTFGDNPAPRGALGRLDIFKDNPTALDGILGDVELVVPQFVVFCPECNVSHLAFPDRAKAESAIVESGRRCLMCAERKMRVIETFAVSEAYLQGLSQGLWLESLVSDVVTSRTDAVWTGQMIEANEIDVLSVFADRTLLVECKDTSFGQNDLYLTGVRAQHVGADLVVIVSTADVNPNVRDALRKMGREREFQVVSQAKAELIQAELTKILDDISQKRLTTWFRREGGLDIFDSSIRVR